MKKFKRIFCIITALLLTSLSLVGCALFERDVEYYNNIVVATVGTDITIKKKQLMDAYSNFGYQYVQNQGMTMSQAVEKTLDYLIDREILAQLSLEMFGDLTKNEEAKMRKTAFDALDEALEEMSDTVRKESKIEDSVKEETETDAKPKTHDVYTPYEKYIEKCNQTFTIEVKGTNNETKTEIKTINYKLNLASYYNVEDYTDTAYEWVQSIRGDEGSVEASVAKKALNQIVSTLRNNEKGLTFKNNEDKDVIQRELDRIQEEERKNILTARFETYFNQGISKTIDRENMSYEEYEAEVIKQNYAFVQNLVTRAEEYYKKTVRTQVDRFNKGIDTVSSIGDSIISSIEGRYYIPQAMINDYFIVSHILISYTEEQKTELAEIEAEYKASKNKEDYENKLALLRAKTGGYERNEKGEEVGEWKTAAQILARIQGKVEGRTEQEKVAAFHECIYMFNTDPGMTNPEFEYVIGIDKSQMVEAFTKSSRELYGYDTETKKLKKNSKGTMSGLVWTEYGAHIIMYTRDLSDFIYHNSATQLDSTFENYLFATQTSYGNKTFFDSIVGTLSTRSYSDYERGVLAKFKQANDITINKSKYKDLLSNS